jgi:hypothetical protein
MGMINIVVREEIDTEIVKRIMNKIRSSELQFENVDEEDIQIPRHINEVRIYTIDGYIFQFSNSYSQGNEWAGVEILKKAPEVRE